MTTSCPHSTILLAFSSTMLATFTCLSAGSSNVEATTSAFTLRAMSVTSSGRSSIRSTIMYTSGWLSAIAFAIDFRSIVLPVFGCATISPRCPFPIGVNMSTIRHDMSLCPLPRRLNFSSGNRGVRKSNGILSLMNSGVRPLMYLILTRGKYLSPALGGLISPVTVSPVLRACCLI